MIGSSDDLIILDIPNITIKKGYTSLLGVKEDEKLMVKLI